MKAVHFIILLYNVFCLTHAEKDEREPQSRSLINNKHGNSVVVSSSAFAYQRQTKPPTVDPLIQVDQNITFYNIGCVVGRSCSHIIHPNLPKAKPTFKPYTKDDHSHFKGTLSMLYPPRTNGTEETLKLTSGTSKLPSTTTQTPSTPKNTWIVKPPRKQLPSLKEEKATHVINSILNILHEFTPYYGGGPGKSSEKVNKTESRPKTDRPSIVTAATTTKPKLTRDPDLGIALYRKPPNNLHYKTRPVELENKRPVIFENNRPVYSVPSKTAYPDEVKTTFTTLASTKQGAQMNEKTDPKVSWYQALLEGTNRKTTTKPEQKSSYSNSWYTPGVSVSPHSERHEPNPKLGVGERPVSSYENFFQTQGTGGGHTLRHATIETQPSRPTENNEIVNSLRPNIITAQDLRRKKEDEEKEARLQKLKKQQQFLKPFIVSTSFGFDPKRGRSIDTSNKVSEELDTSYQVSAKFDTSDQVAAKLKVLPSRGRSVIRQVGGHAIEMDAKSVNLTALIFSHELNGRSLRQQPTDQNSQDLLKTANSEITEHNGSQSYDDLGRIQRSSTNVHTRSRISPIELSSNYRRPSVER